MTARRFTGQYHEAGLPGGEGLYYYNARWYDAQLGRFVSADAIVPDPNNPQDLNRYSYVRNNPVRFTDPSGHAICLDEECRQLVHPISLQPIGSWHKPRPYRPPSEGSVQASSGGCRSIVCLPTPTPTISPYPQISLLLTPTPTPYTGPYFYAPIYGAADIYGEGPVLSEDEYNSGWHGFQVVAGRLAGAFPAVALYSTGGWYYSRMEVLVRRYSNGSYVLITDEYDTRSLRAPLHRSVYVKTATGYETERIRLGSVPPGTVGTGEIGAGFWVPKERGTPSQAIMELTVLVPSSFLSLPFLFPGHLSPLASYQVHLGQR